MAFAVPADAAVLREQEILDLVTHEVMVRQNVAKRDLEVVWQDMAASSLVAVIPEGRMSLEISKTARLGGRGNVPVQILVDGKKYRTIFPRIEIKVFQKVLVAKTRIPRGTLASGQDVGMARLAVSGMYQPPLTTPTAVLGAEATRDIAEGTVITAQMFRLPNVVKIGDNVAVVYINGDLTLIYSGKAKSSGAVGSLVKVMNPESKKEFTARVVGPNRVEIKVEE